MSITVQSPETIGSFVTPRLESVSSIFTVSRADVYDYRRCPKIVAIKTYRATRTKSIGPRVQGVPIPNILGEIGEAAVRLAFLGNGDNQHPVPRQIPTNRITQPIMSRLRIVDKAIRSDLERLPKQGSMRLEHRSIRLW